MGLVLKYARLTKAGTWQYRRRIPTAIRNVLNQGEFKRFIGATRPEAMKAYPRTEAEFDALVREAMRRRDTNAESPASPLELHQRAERRAKELAKEVVILGGQEIPASDPDAARLLRESYISRLPVDPATGDPVGGDPVEGRALGILVSGGLSRPAPTLEDAKRLYLRERIKGDINERQKTQRLTRVMAYLTHAIEADRRLDRLTREDAREVRDHMLRDLNIKPATVGRYMNDIRALIAFGITEFGLRDALNPFLRLSIRVETVAREERSPLPEKTLKAVRARISARAGADLWQIWRILEGTGCRLGEVTGLLVSDVHLDAAVPYLDLIHHPHRRLKTAGSIRRVPLVGEALSAAKEAVKAAGDGPALFSRYGRGRGADTASASLMKHLRAVTDDPKIVVHSLRHTMKDRLIRARVGDAEQDLVLGHSNGTMGERYGGPDARLEVAHAAVKAALGK